MQREVIHCDLCKNEMGKDNKRTLHLKSVERWTWSRSRKSEDTEIDICDRCYSFIEKLLNYKKRLNIFKAVFELREEMCLADQQIFDNMLWDMAKQCDRYFKNHKTQLREVG